MPVRQLEEEDEEEDDITEEGEDAEEQQVRVLQLLVFPVRALAQGSLCPGARRAITGSWLSVGRRIFKS